MQRSAHPIPTALKAIGLITASSVSGVYMGYSAIGQIDPFYYSPRVHETRYIPSATHSETASYAGYPPAPYEVDYPYAPEPAVPEPGVEPETPVESLPDATHDVAANSNLRMAPAPGTTPEPQPTCQECGGPYGESPAPEPAEAFRDEGSAVLTKDPAP